MREPAGKPNTEPAAAPARQATITSSKRLVHNTVFNVAGLVTNAMIGFFLVRYFWGVLGKDRYGVWILVGGAMFKYAGLFQMGLNSSVNRYIPVYLAKGDTDGIGRVVSTTMFFYAMLSLVLIGLTLVLHYNIDAWFAVSDQFVPIAEKLVLIVGFCFALALPLQICAAILSGLQRYGISNLTFLAAVITRTVVLVILLNRGYGLMTMGLVFGSTEILFRIAQFAFAGRLLPGFVISPSKIDVPLLREMLAYGVNTFLYASGAVIIYNASNIVIGVLIGESDVTLFNTAAAAVLLLSQFVIAFTRAIKPAVSELDALDEGARVRELAFLTQKYTLLLIVPAGVFLVVMGESFLNVWVGAKVEDPGIVPLMASVLAILAVGHCVQISQYSSFIVLVGRGRHRVFGLLMAITTLLCVGGSVFAVKVMGLGLKGIAYANAIPMVLTSGLFLPIYFNRQMKISFGDSLKRVLRPALAGCLGSVVLIVLWQRLHEPGSWAELLYVLAATGLLMAAGAWLFAMDRVERRRFATVFVRRTTRSADK